MDKIKNSFSNLFSAKYRSRTVSYLIVVVSYFVIQAMISSGTLSLKMKTLMVPLCAYIICALALNLTVGVLGELSLGQAGFMSVGGFTGAVVCAVLLQKGVSFGLTMFIAIIAGAIVAAIFGFIIGIPVLKLQGDYLAIVTLAFGQIVKTIISNLYVYIDSKGLHTAFINNTIKLEADTKSIIDGPIGLSGNARISTITIGFILVIVTLFIIYNLMYSKSGRAIMAFRDNKIAASSVGVNINKYKLMAFVISAAIGGMGGVLYAMNYATITPAKFDFNLSIMILVYVVLGGLGNMTGTIIATTILVILPEQLRSLNDYRMLIYAVVLIVIMVATNNDKLNTFVEKTKVTIKSKFAKKEAK